MNTFNAEIEFKALNPKIKSDPVVEKNFIHILKDYEDPGKLFLLKDENLTILSINDQCAKVLGYKNAEEFFELTSGKFIDFIANPNAFYINNDYINLKTKSGSCVNYKFSYENIIVNPHDKPELSDFFIVTLTKAFTPELECHYTCYTDLLAVLKTDLYLKVVKINLNRGCHRDVVIGIDIGACPNPVKKRDVNDLFIEFVEEGGVWHEDVPAFLDFCNTHKWKDEFDKGVESLSFIYRRKHFDKYIWVSLEVVKSLEYTEELPIVIIYVQNIDDKFKVIQENKRLSKSVDEQREQLLQQGDDLVLQQQISKSFAMIYFNSWYVDLKNNNMSALSLAEHVKKDALFYNGDFKKTVPVLIEHFVSSEYKRKLKAFTDPSTVTERMKGNLSLSCDYLNNRQEWIKALMIPIEYNSEGQLEKLVFALQFIDNEKREEIARIEKMEKDKQQISELHGNVQDKSEIISAMSRIYYCNYLVNIDEETFVELTSKDYLKTYTSNTNNARVALNSWITLGCDPNFVESMLEFADLDTIRERLAKQDIITTECISKTSGWVEISLIVVKRDENGVAKKVLWSSRYIDDKKKAELETKHALNLAYLAANKSNEAKTSFLTAMSHDIRTPMNAIIGMTAIAKNNLGNAEKIDDCLKKISISSQHLLSLINKVLDMSKIESGKLEFCQNEFSMKNAISNLEIICKVQIDSKKQKLNIYNNNIIHDAVIGDSNRLQQALVNLISNASKYSDEGKEINFYVTEIESNNEENVCFEFLCEDQGIGMSKDFLEHIFEPFSRDINASRSNEFGAGLGMAITRNIIYMMDGDLRVESELNKGTRVTATIYLKSQKRFSQENVSEFKNLNVLVIDTDFNTRKDKVQCLSNLGLNVTELDSYELLVSHIVGNLDHEYFAIIIDWKPDDGETLMVIKELKGMMFNDFYLIVTSSFDLNEIEYAARTVGANYFINQSSFKLSIMKVLKELCHLKVIQEEVLEKEDKEKYYLDNPLHANINSDFSGKRVLLVEDNSLNIEIAKEILEMSNLEVDVAINGLEALNLMKEVKDGYYDLIFMDIQMPIMNGLESAEAIRAIGREYTSNVPIVAMTANAFADDVVATRKAGMNEHLPKPINFEQLVEVLNRFIK